MILKIPIFQSLDSGSILPLQGVCDPVTGNTPLMYAAMENKVRMMVKFWMVVEFQQIYGYNVKLLESVFQLAHRQLSLHIIIFHARFQLYSNILKYSDILAWLSTFAFCTVLLYGTIWYCCDPPDCTDLFTEIFAHYILARFYVAIFKYSVIFKYACIRLCTVLLYGTSWYYCDQG